MCTNDSHLVCMELYMELLVQDAEADCMNG